jgi:hypothetical protein
MRIAFTSTLMLMGIQKTNKRFLYIILYVTLMLMKI